MYKHRRKYYRRVRLTPLGMVVVVCVVLIIASLTIWEFSSASAKRHRNATAKMVVKKPSQKPRDAQPGGRTQDMINEIDKNIGAEATNDNAAVSDELDLVTAHITTLSTVGDSIDAATLR